MAASCRRSLLFARPLRRHRRLALEPLESRALLAFDLTLSTAATTGIAVTDTSTTRTFTASAHGANLSFADIQLALDAAFSVSISPGTTGTESGNVISTEAVSFNNSSAAGLTLLTGSGANQVGNVTLAGLGFSDPATNVQLNAAGNIAFTGGVNVTPTGSLAITSFGGTVNSAGGQLVSGALTLNAKTSIGSAASPLLVNTNTLTTNTTNGLSTQFITEANGLTALDLRASSGTINLNITSGGVFDTDSSTDISATWIIVSLLDANPRDFGTVANPIATSSLFDLEVSTASGGGNQFIYEVDSLSGVNLDAGLGNVNLQVGIGSITDNDPDTDITAAAANIVLRSGSTGSIGSSTTPFQTSVSDLSVSTSLGSGDQYLVNTKALSALNLTGSSVITLTVLAGGVTDDDTATDIDAATAHVILADTSAHDIGTPTHPFATDVLSLFVNTDAAGGNQFLTARGLTAINLNAGTGNIVLDVLAGGIPDVDTSTDIIATAATVILSQTSAVQNVGSSSSPLNTQVNDLTVTTTAGRGSQYISEADGLSSLNLNAGSGSITLTLKNGSLTDPDSAVDLTGSTVTVTMSGAQAGDFGSTTSPIATSADRLFVDTSAKNGNQFITEANGITGLGFDAGTGNVTLDVATGGITALAVDPVITATNTSITLRDPTPHDLGTVTSPIFIWASDISINTAAGGGNQFIRPRIDLTAIDLNAGSGNITVAPINYIGINDSDSSTDITANNATLTLTSVQSFGILKSIGTVTSPIQTSVNDLSVSTTHDVNIFITESDGLTGLNLVNDFFPFASSSRITLVLLKGGISDSDTATDLKTRNATIILSDPSAATLGDSAHPLQTEFVSLTTATSAGGGDQYLVAAQDQVAGNVSAINLNAGSGDIALIAAGSVIDTDSATDIIAASLTLSGGASGSGGFGSVANPLQLNVDTLATGVAPAGVSLAEADSLTITHFVTAGPSLPGLILLAGGIFNLAEGDAINDLSPVEIDSPAVLNLASTDETFAALRGNGTIQFKADGASHRLQLGRTGTSGSIIFSGNLVGNDSPAGTPFDSLVKVSSTTLTLSGNNPFTGAYDVQAGKVLVTGSIGSSTAHVAVTAAGATLGGTGTISRDVDIAAGGHLAPGVTVGVLTTGSTNFAAGSSFDVGITSAAAGSFDQLKPLGSVVLDTTGAGVALNTSAVGTLSLQPDNKIIVIDNDGNDAVVGIFAGLPEKAIVSTNFLGSGLVARITYSGGDGNDVALLLSPSSAWFNSAMPLDVNADGQIVAGDALAVINYLNSFGAGPVPTDAQPGQPYGYLDVDGDNNVSPIDALTIINVINAGLSGEGEPGGPMSIPSLPLNPPPTASPASLSLDELIDLLAAEASDRTIGPRPPASLHR